MFFEGGKMYNNMYWLSTVVSVLTFFLAELELRNLAKASGQRWLEKRKQKIMSSYSYLERKEAEKRAQNAAERLTLPFFVPFFVLGLINTASWNFLSLLIFFCFSVQKIITFLCYRDQKQRIVDKEFLNYCLRPGWPFQADFADLGNPCIIGPLLSLFLIVGHFCLR